MAFFQDVVYEYLQRLDRSTFIKTECLVSLDPPLPEKDRHWYCDVVAVHFRQQRVYLCEITYAITLHDLYRRLKRWSENWPVLRAKFLEDCSIPQDWEVVPWVFVPKKLRAALDKKLATLSPPMPQPIVTELEQVLPWVKQVLDGTTPASQAN